MTGGPAASGRSGTLGRILENAMWLLAGKGVGAVLSLFYLALATRTLGLEGFGQFVLILGTAQAVSAFVQFQTWQVVVRFGMEHLNGNRPRDLSRIIVFSGALDLGSAIFGCGLAVAVVALLGPHFGWDAALSAQALAFTIVTLLSIRSTATGILRLHDKFAISAAADSVIPIVRLIGAVAAVALSAGVTGFLVAWAVAEIATAIVYWLFAARVSRPTFHWPGWQSLRAVPADHPGLWRFAAITNAASTVDIASKQVTVMIVGLFAGPAAAGGYRLAWQLGQALAKTSEMLSRAMFAELTRVNFGDMRANLPRLFRNASRFAFIAAALIVTILLLVGEPALRLVAGPEFASAYPLLILLGMAAALDLGGVAFEPALLATNKAWLAFRLRAAAAVLMFALLAVLLPLYGTWGAAAAALAASGASLVMLGTAAWRSVHAPPKPAP